MGFRTLRCVIGKEHDRIDGEAVLFVQPSKVGEHAPGEVGLRPGLVFDMNQKERLFSPKAGFHQQIDFMLLTGRHIGKDFLVQKLKRVRIQVGGDIGQTAKCLERAKTPSSRLPDTDVVLS